MDYTVTYNDNIFEIIFNDAFNNHINSDWLDVEYLARDYVKSELNDIDSLIEIYLGKNFNQDIHHIKWPTNLSCIHLGRRFNNDISSLSKLSKLHTLYLINNYNFFNHKLILCDTITKLNLEIAYRLPMDAVIWPSNLQILYLSRYLNRYLNQGIGHIKFPVSLIELYFDTMYNTCIKHLPMSLIKLEFGSNFNQKITDILWPPLLEYLRFGYYFNQDITCIMLKNLMINFRITNAQIK
jgi:hypothetical protein